jgi:hypothetical protein
MFTQVNEMAQTMDGLIFHLDYRRAESSFMDILKTVQEATKGMPGSAPIPYPDHLGRHVAVDCLARNFFQQQQFSLQIPTFHNMEDAFAFARMEIEKQGQTHKTASE